MNDAKALRLETAEIERLTEYLAAWIRARKRNEEVHALYSKSLADLRDAEESLAEVTEQVISRQ